MKMQWIILLLGLFFLGETIRNSRMYIQTKLTGYLLLWMGSTMGLIGCGIWYFISPNWIIFGILLVIGLILVDAGILILGTKESGARAEICERTTYLQWLKGNISSVEKKKYPPILKKHHGIMMGSLAIMVGISCIFLPPSYLHNIVSILIGIGFGTTLIILSIIYGK